jgi:glutamate-ammonia-ligase adenylyltransferase
MRLNAGPENDPYPFHVRREFSLIVPTLLEEISATADPDGILMRLGSILSNLRAPSAIYSMLNAHPVFCRYLVTLVSNSQYLSEMLVRDPGLFEILETEAAVTEPASREVLEHELNSLSNAYIPEAAPYRFRDAEVLRICIRELFHEADVVEVGRELTLVAELCLNHVLQRAREDVARKYGPAQGNFAVLGLGKLGGQELGYGSDLDLVFVYESDAEMESGMVASEYYAALAARVIHRIKEPTRFGMLYDVDARLRPDGRKGVLAVSSRRFPEYYLEEAQAWERMALMKVRSVAGTPEFASKIEHMALDLAFTLPLTKENITQIDTIRQKIVKAASPLELKKAEGGLIELEFALRLLQLKYVAQAPDLRRANVLSALDVLAYGQLIPTATYHVLREAYLLLRRVENRIRMMHGRSESSLPQNERERQELARRLGIERDLADLVLFHKTRVHRIYLNVFDQVAGD